MDTIKEKPPAKSCGTCGHWQRDAEYCAWPDPLLPFWASIINGDHGNYTQETDGKRCPTWVALSGKANTFDRPGFARDLGEAVLASKSPGGLNLDIDKVHASGQANNCDQEEGA